jgi:hypothetical protein
MASTTNLKDINWKTLNMMGGEEVVITNNLQSNGRN